MRVSILLTLLIGSLVAAPRHTRADEFRYIDAQGQEQTLEARLLGSGQEVHALLKANGQVELVPIAAVQERIPKDGPPSADEAAMIASLEAAFEGKTVRTRSASPFLVAFVAAGDLDRRTELRVKGFLDRLVKFLGNVDDMFADFARENRFPYREPDFPMVLVVFETDADFEEYTQSVTQGAGISAGNIAGFYSALSNWLAIRLEECRTFRVPLHEAIHQQMYNRVFQRFAPVPKWFDEGIATGFENTGERVVVSPAKVNSQYAQLARSRDLNAVSWADVVNNDNAFGGDILASEAYVEAWGLHWMLVTQHKDKYGAYVTALAQREPLQEAPDAERTEQLESAFGVSVGELAGDFPRALESAVRRQKVKFPAPPPAGVSLTNEALAEVRMNAVNDVAAGRLRVIGSVRNTSPIRGMTYHVAVISGSGEYADWVVPLVEPGKSITLPEKAAAKVLPGAPGGLAGQFMVRVQSTLAGGSEAAKWVQSPPLPAGFGERTR